MKSGLGDRNNAADLDVWAIIREVSMKSGLGDRNNSVSGHVRFDLTESLNEVRSWRPEQSGAFQVCGESDDVSMKSGLGDRNNRRVITEKVTNSPPSQ